MLKSTKFVPERKPRMSEKFSLRALIVVVTLTALLLTEGVSARREMHAYEDMEKYGEFGGDPTGAQFGQSASRTAHWTDLISKYTDDVFDQIGFNKLYDDLSEVYSMMSRSPDYVNRLRRLHSERGAFRSGEGTPDQVHHRVKVFEENQRLAELEESKEIVTDPSLADK